MNLPHQKVHCPLPRWLQEIIPQQSPVVLQSRELILEDCHQQDLTNPQVGIKDRSEQQVAQPKGQHHQECQLVQPNAHHRLATLVRKALQYQPQVELVKEILPEHPPEGKEALVVALGAVDVSIK